MCGRYSLYTDPETLAAHFELAEAPDWSAHYNITPGSEVVAIGLSRDGQRRASRLHWGLIPAWARDTGIGHKLINARAETVAEKPAFRDAIRKHRCLIPANGFFEWRRDGNTREPWFIHRRDDDPMAFAGIWSQWQDRATGEKIASCSIITTAANATLSPIHERMPVLIERGDYARWLEDEGNVEALLRPAADNALEAYRVDARVNNPRNDTPDCIRPLTTSH